MRAGLYRQIRERSADGSLEVLSQPAGLARLRARAPRIAFVTVATVLSLAGLRQVVAPRRAPILRTSVASAGVDTAAHAFALQFARAYLSYDAADPAARAAALEPFALSGSDPDLSYTPPARGAQGVVWADVAQDQPALAGGRIVTVAAQLTSVRAPVYLAVPVRRDGSGALALAGYPAFVGAPAIGASSPPARREVDDRGLSKVAIRAVTNYLARDGADLDADLSDRAVVTLPAVAMRVTGTDSVAWAQPGGGGVLVTVRALDPRGAEATLAYELRVVHRDRWQVTSIEVVPTKT
jgi:hypothetical protein